MSKSKYFVICGNRQQFEHYMREKFDSGSFLAAEYPDRRDWVYVSGMNSVRGYRIEHGVFYGTWRQISQLEDLFHVLLSHCEPGSPAFHKIKTVYEAWLKE